MKSCFVDTFFFLALLNPTDSFHSKALYWNTVDRKMITSEWVLLEMTDHLCNAVNRKLPAAVRTALGNDPRFEIVPVEAALLSRAIELFDRRPDKNWSLTDCTSFILMNDQKISDALTGDHHFEQAGFQILID